VVLRWGESLPPLPLVMPRPRITSMKLGGDEGDRYTLLAMASYTEPVWRAELRKCDRSGSGGKGLGTAWPSSSSCLGCLLCLSVSAGTLILERPELGPRQTRRNALALDSRSRDVHQVPTFQWTNPGDPMRAWSCHELYCWACAERSMATFMATLADVADTRLKDRPTTYPDSHWVWICRRTDRLRGQVHLHPHIRPRPLLSYLRGPPPRRQKLQGKVAYPSRASWNFAHQVAGRLRSSHWRKPRRPLHMMDSSSFLPGRTLRGTRVLPCLRSTADDTQKHIGTYATV